jgi:hypothetical protein
MVVLAPLTVFSERPSAFGERLVVGHESSRVAERPQVLRRIEAESPRGARGAGPVTIAGGTVRLAGVLDDRESVPERQPPDGGHVGELSVEMDRHDEAGSRSDNSACEVHIESVVSRGDVDWNRNSPGLRDGLPGSDEGLGRHQHLVAGLNLHGEQGEPERVETTARADAEVRPAVRGEIALEGLHDRAVDEDARFDHAGDRLENLFPQRLTYVAEVDERNPAPCQEMTLHYRSDVRCFAWARPQGRPQGDLFSGVGRVQAMRGGLRAAVQSQVSATETGGTDTQGLVEAFIAWLDRFGEQSQDPYDLWATSLGRKAKRLYYRRTVLGSLPALPFVFLDTFVPGSRRLVSPPHRYPIADAQYALAFFAWAAATGDSGFESRGEHFLVELGRSRCPGFEDHCWGLPFNWESRAGTIAAETPLITVVPYAYEAFEAGHESTGKPAYLAVMKSIATFAHDRIPVTELDGGAAAAAYSPFDRTRVVNASSYRAYLLASAGRRFAQADWTSEAARNVAFVLASQHADGSWPYAPTAGNEFVDNLHTCLVLKNLFKYWRLTERADVLTAVRRGYAYYRRELLDEDTQPIPFAIRPRLCLHRLDLYDYAEGINLAVLLRDHEPDAAQILQRLLEGLGGQMALPDGHFVTRRLVIGRNAVPYHRWAQSQIFHALAQYCRHG